MTANHLTGGADLAARSVGVFSETSMAGFGFGLGVSVLLDPATAQVPGSPGDFAWGGAASTYFWVDPAEQLTAIFMTQFVPSSAYNIRRELRSIIAGAVV
jgi:CubicO group peptidase (beta-lactamase class C family)